MSTTNHTPFIRIVRSLVLVGIAASAACTTPLDIGPLTSDPGTPIGPKASSATEAWPNRPEQPAPLSPAEVAEGCAAWAACQVEDPSNDGLITTDLCVLDVVWSAERAIPMSYIILGESDERAETFVRCALESGADCEAMAKCHTERTAKLYCEEDGCRPDDGVTYDEVTCEGSVAVMRTGTETHKRDCAAAFTECDTSSPTGCTDRHFTACAEGLTGATCDGAIRLGCDGKKQVSYHDCERLGGTCGVTKDGAEDCIYKSPPDEGCAEMPAGAKCEGDKLETCVLGTRVSVPSWGICKPTP